MKKTSANILIFIMSIFSTATPAFSAGSTSEEGLGCGGGLGPIGEALCKISSDAQTGGEIVGEQANKIISSFIGLLTIMASLWFAFKFITAGFQYISAGGDKANTEAAQKQITNALIGIVIVVGSWVILGVIGKMLGLEILNPGQALVDLVK